MDSLFARLRLHFFAPERDSELAFPWRLLIQTGRVLFAIQKDWKRKDLSLQAMGLAFMTLLSLVPLLAVSFSFLKAFGVHHALAPLLLQLVEPLGDKGGEIVERLLQFVDRLNVSVIGGLGLLILLFAVFNLLSKIETSFNATWHVRSTRSFSNKSTHYIGILVLAPVLVFAALWVWAAVARSTYIDSILQYGWFSGLIWALVKLAPTIFIAAAFSIFYMVMTNTQIRFSSAVVGGLSAGILWQTSGLLFSALVVKSGQYTAIYSALATPILFMIWVYLSWLVLLLGARIAYYHQNPYQLLGHLQHQLLSPVQRLALTLWFLREVWEKFSHGEGGVRATELSAASHTPPKIIENVAQQLAGMGLVSEKEGGWICWCDYSQLPWARFIEMWLRYPEQQTAFTGSIFESFAFQALKGAGDNRHYHLFGQQKGPSVKVTLHATPIQSIVVVL